MKSDNFTGGPAFPLHSTGMTLRDYFAAHALTARWMMQGNYTEHKSVEAAQVAAEVYAIADAMLAERAK